MGLSLKPEHLKRYAQVARLLSKYGRSDLVQQTGLEDALEDEQEPASPQAQARAEELAGDLERMGPTFVKLGQLLSTRVDILPLAYTEALSRLQDKVEPFSFPQVEHILREELGVRLSKAFSELNPVPLAAASLGQVHWARLRDGRGVAVKVQRPDIREQIVSDFEMLEDIADLLDRHTEAGHRYGFGEMLEEMRRALLRELDYRQEASNLATLGRNLATFPRIVVPRPVEDYSTSRVLTMDFVHGKKITSIGPLTRLEMDGDVLAEELFEAYLKQILVDGFFHADPHPGNVLLTSDGHLALVDVGMVGRVSPGLQDDLLRLLLAMSEGQGEETADLMVRMGQRLDGFNRKHFENEITELVVRNRDASAEQLQIGRLVIATTRAAGESALRVPPQLTMLGKTLLNLDQVGRTLDPSFEPNAAIRRNAGEMMRQRMLRSASPGNVLSSVLEMNEFVQRLPGRLNRVLDAVGDREMEVRIRVMNESVMMDGLQKIANRIALGVVLAALIIGAAMLMRIETRFRILGYPGLAMLLFLVAAAGGLYLMADVLLHDRREQRPPEP